MAWVNERIACICVVLFAIFRYNCAGKSCHYHWQCSPDEKCCKGNCSTNCLNECSVSSDCTLDERCCYFGVNFTRKCEKFCSVKTCQTNRDCGFGQMCCARNSGTRRCERSCTFGKRCTSDMSSGSREYCCLNIFGARQCARSCTIQKTCIRNRDCTSPERCCGSGVKKCRRNCLPEKELSCFTDESCSIRNIGECCKNGVCQESCDNKARNWYIAIGVFAFIFSLSLRFPFEVVDISRVSKQTRKKLWEIQEEDKMWT